MRKMTGVLIKEWSQFVLKEVCEIDLSTLHHKASCVLVAEWSLACSESIPCKENNHIRAATSEFPDLSFCTWQ